MLSYEWSHLYGGGEKKNSWRNEDVLNSFVEEYTAGYEDILH